ncbi:alpha/beta hydrolase [Acinetobacter cumulans]|uniref:Alpha/beta hydrolase n=2 Tax=Acinetobacter cumulans TaxID=2136182 RepID=A0A3A8G8C9_9GAMM|nr:alpha/beta hydrolase [Acinetobacter cumulans]
MEIKAMKVYLSALLLFFISGLLNAAEINFQNILQQERTWAGLESKTLKVGEVEWRYSEGGSRSKPTLLLLHGLSGTRDNWNRVARYFTPYYHVIIPDLPAHGETKTPENFDLSIPNLTEKLRRFADAAQFDPNLHLAGHSMGGAIAMLYAAQYPTEVKSLLLVDAAGVYRSANTAYLKNPEQLRNIVVEKPGDFDRLMNIAMQAPPFIPQELKVAQEKLMIAQSKNTHKMVSTLVEMSKLYTPESFAMATRMIDAPVMIVWGRNDQVINVEVAQELHGLFKKSEAPLILNGVGHMPILEAEQLVAQPYLKFLNTVK